MRLMMLSLLIGCMALTLVGNSDAAPSTVSVGPICANIVAKATQPVLWNSNLKQSNRDECAFESTLSACARFLNQCFALRCSKYFCNNICCQRTPRFAAKNSLGRHRPTIDL